MDIDQFDYPLPESLIAQYPSPQRCDSRLMVLDGDSGTVEDLEFRALTHLLAAGDLLVFNDTRVIPARLFGRKDTGGRIELLVERVLGDATVLAQLKASKTPRAGQLLHIDTAADPATARIVERRGMFFVIEFVDARAMQIMAEGGHVPLPPYIARADEALDRERYQTVYARRPGAVAAPTAGLHFDRQSLKELAARGVASTYVTLHVGAGTFAPIRVGDIREHRMHHEWFEVTRSVCDAVAATRARGRRVIAVGTTSVRALESAAVGGTLRPFSGETDLFLYPGSRFAVVDAMVTNFHLPRSTLLMLVCAFAGTEQTLAAYRHAVTIGYRFFSYGDAMFVTPQRGALRR